MPKTKKVATTSKVAKVPGKAVAVVAKKAPAKVAKAAWQPYAERAKGFAKKDNVKGQPLKVAYPGTPEELKTRRRKMRAAVRAGTAEGKILAAHMLGNRWSVSPAMLRAAKAVCEG